MENKTYTLRSLQGRDTFAFARILRKIGLKELKKCFSSEDVKNMIKMAKGNGEKVDVDEIGLNIFVDALDHVLNKYPDCEKEIYSFLAGLSGMKPDEVGTMDAASFVNMIVDVFKDPTFADFFTAATRFVK